MISKKLRSTTMMYWKYVPLEQFPEGCSAFFSGIPWLPPKSEWWKPWNSWRFVWPWHVFLILSKTIEPCYVFFRSGDHAMRRRQLVTTPYVGVRIGNGEVRFAFTDADGKPLQVELQTASTPLRRSEALKFDITLV